jgi:SWIM zinc finger
VPAAWTADQVLALAPDASSAKAAHKQGNPAVWSGQGASERALWGLCQGSGAKPYETVVELAEPAFRCSCPSRKFPCKHALGLMLLWTSGAVSAGEEPDWAASWLDGRAERAAKRDAPAVPQDPARAAEQAAKRVAKREQRVIDGLAELRLWLDDLVRQGLAHAEQRGRREFEQMAARLVDAQAPGLARRVREMGWMLGAGPDWPSRLLARAALLGLLADAYPRHDELPDGLRAELRSQIGWTTATDELLATGERVRGAWRCVGVSLIEEENLRVRRTWLWGEGRWALLLDFAHPSQPLPPAPTAGQTLHAELAFYPAALPLRAQIAEQDGGAGEAPLPAGDSVAGLYRERAAALARNPWIDRLPAALSATPVRRGDRWLLADRDLQAIGVEAPSPTGLDLAALAGGRPVGVFGEWTRDGLRPLSAWSDERLVAL